MHPRRRTRQPRAITTTETGDINVWVSEGVELIEHYMQPILEDPDHILCPHLENLDDQVARTSAELAIVTQMWAQLCYREQKAQRAVKTAEATALLALDDPAYGKLKVDQKKAHVTLDPDVCDAHDELIEITARRKSVEGLILALKHKASVLPGLQGASNNITRLESRY